MPYHVIFSEAKLALGREVVKHPVLVEMLQSYSRDDWGGMLGEIAAYCMITMEGEYLPHELEKLYDILIRELQARRAISINPSIVMMDKPKRLH